MLQGSAIVPGLQKRDGACMFILPDGTTSGEASDNHCADEKILRRSCSVTCDRYVASCTTVLYSGFVVDSN